MRARFSLAYLLVPCLLAGRLLAAPPLLPDQFGGTNGLLTYSGQPVLAIIVDVRKLRWVGRWEEALRAELPGYTSIRIADVTDQPPPSFEKVRNLLLERVPPNISVLIDMDSDWATNYELDTREPCLLVFNADHEVVARFRGRPRGELINAVLAELVGLFPSAERVPNNAANQPDAS